MPTTLAPFYPTSPYPRSVALSTRADLTNRIPMPELPSSNPGMSRIARRPAVLGIAAIANVLFANTTTFPRRPTPRHPASTPEAREEAPVPECFKGRF